MRPPLGSWRWVFRMSVLVIITVLCQLFLALCSLRLPSKLSLLVGPAIVIHAEVLVDSQGPEMICLPLYLNKGFLGMIEEQVFIDKLP